MMQRQTAHSMQEYCLENPSEEIRTVWESGKPEEIKFWRRVTQGKGGPNYEQWRANLQKRARPDAPFRANLVNLVTTAPVESAIIVDLAAGPVSVVGWLHKGHKIDVRPFDALAIEYAEMLEEEGIKPYIPTQLGHSEEIDSLFSQSSVDLVHIRNALDHCYDVPKIIDAVLKILKPHGAFVIETYRNEAETEKYSGLHQWNIDERDGRLMIWRPGVLIDVAEQWGDRAQVNVTRAHPAWLEAVISKR
jgi:hypothetical protein